MGSSWLETFPRLADLETGALDRLRSGTQVVSVAAGETVFAPGMPCRNYLLVLSGVVRVQVTGETGREIVLYRVGPGEACILTTACLMNLQDYAAEGTVERDAEAAVIPAGLFHDLMAESAGFRRFVFDGFGGRIAELMQLVEEVAFQRMDVRLARFLAASDDVLDLTHQALAVELGSAREVISRQLKEFERRGWVSLERGRIVVHDHPSLTALAEDQKT